MRIYLLWLIIFGLIVYAWRNWFVSLCGLIVLSFVMQRKDFPQYIMGINGLNPWNLLLLVICVAWWLDFRTSKRSYDMPVYAKVLMISFIGLIGLSWLRGVVDIDSMPEEISFIGFTGEYLINPIKFIVPGLLLFDGCRSKKRVLLALGTVFFTAFAYSALVIKRVPISSLFSGSEEVFMAYRHRVDRDVGLMAIDMSMLLAGVFWALFIFTFLYIRRWQHRVLLFCPLGVILLGMALCHSRGSYVGFAAAGLVLAVVRLRKLLLLLPVGAVMIALFMPAIPARLGMGFGQTSVTGEEVKNWDEITAGRTTDLWPAAIEQIGKNPVIGFGVQACNRTELHDEWLETGGAPSHPHNAYLEILLDMGLVGFFPIMMLYGGIAWIGLILFSDRKNPLFATVGGAALATVIVLAVTAMACQSFYPTQSTLPLWCLWGVALRGYVVRRSARTVRQRRPSAVVKQPAGNTVGPVSHSAYQTFVRKDAPSQ